MERAHTMTHRITGTWIILLTAGCWLALTGASAAESLWSPSSAWNTAYADDKARGVGDVVTVVVLENSSASERASSTADRENTLNAGLSALLNPSIDESIFGSQGGSITYPRIAFNGNSEFEGQGTLTRSGNISATVSATVKQVMPNGNLLIEGKRSFLVNKERRQIILTGIIRPRDIDGQNRVYSTQIADLQITYEGKGPVTDKAKPGFFSTLFDLIPIF